MWSENTNIHQNKNLYQVPTKNSLKFITKQMYAHCKETILHNGKIWMDRRGHARWSTCNLKNSANKHTICI